MVIREAFHVCAFDLYHFVAVLVNVEEDVQPVKA